MTFYLTYNDVPSGIYSSQVIDVVKFLRKEFNANIKLVSLISVRGFFENRKKIKSELSDAIVVPMFPGVKRWRKNYPILNFLCSKYKPNLIIGRSVLATQLALSLKKNKKINSVVYDGRGAICAEWKEYNVITETSMLSEISNLERSAVNDSDFRIAVSEQLIKYWEKEYNYNSSQHVVIPCTLNNTFLQAEFGDQTILKARNELGLKNEDIVLAYSGSAAGWQSFELLYSFLKPVLSSQLNVKLLFLSGHDPNIDKFEQEFPGRIVQKKVSHDMVPFYLSAADYGLLIREKTITNRVASPVKFAEYLACGLPVIISENLGDYSHFVAQNSCGFVAGDKQILIRKSKGTILRELGSRNFSKQNFINSYKKLLTINGSDNIHN